MSPKACRLPLLVLLLSALALPARADEAENRERLRQMPLSRRADLLKNLERFRALPSAEQAAIRELDREIAGEDPAVRSRHLAVLRRYHLWLASLPEPQRKAMQEASPDKRLVLMEEYLRTRPRDGANPGRNDSRIWVQLTNLSPQLLIDQAHWIRLWLGLSPEQRSAIDKELSEPARIRLLERFGRDNGVPDERPALRRAESETLRHEIEKRPRLKKKFEQAKPAAKRAMFGRINERKALVESVDARVDRQHLDQFVASIPPWLLTSVDSLPPDAAALRMRILYRMIFPEGTEMPPAEVPEPKPSAKPAPTIPPPTAPGGASPF